MSACLLCGLCQHAHYPRDLCLIEGCICSRPRKSPARRVSRGPWRPVQVRVPGSLMDSTWFECPECYVASLTGYCGPCNLMAPEITALRNPKCPHCGAKNWRMDANTVRSEGIQTCASCGYVDGDDEDVGEMGVDETLAAIARCARSWDPDARLLGNLRAEDIAVACESAGRLAESRRKYGMGFRDKWQAARDLVKRAFPLVALARDTLDGEDTGRTEWLRDARAILNPGANPPEKDRF